MKCFFPVENSHFGRPKTNFRRFQKWKAKKKKKKKVLTSFSDVFLLPFQIFHLFCSIFTPFPFFLASFFPIRQQKFPGQKSLGGHSAPPCPPACYATVRNANDNIHFCWQLRVRAFFHKSVRVCHVYCNFKIGCTCRITVIFGTLKDGSLFINTLASNICFSYRNMFQNGVNALSKIVDAFLSKSSKFYLVWIIR